VTKPRLAFVLNGSAFDSSAATTPFAQTRETDVQFNIPALDLAPYLPYWPAQWPVRPQAGVLQLALKLAFEQREVPQVAVSGEVSLAGVRLQLVLPGAAGLDVLAFERLGVKIARLEPLAQRVDLALVEWQAPCLSLARDAAGQLNLARIVAGFATSGPALPDAPTAASPAASPWQVRVGQVALTRGTVRWDDAAVKPQARLALEDLPWTVRGVNWPMKAPAPFDASARLGSTKLTVQGSATHATAQAQLSLGELPLSVAAPYMK